MVWRTYRRIVQRIVGLHLPGAETVELFVLCKKVAFRERAVQAPDTVKQVVGCQKVVARIGDSLDVAWRNVARHTDKCEVFSCH